MEALLLTLMGFGPGINNLGHEAVPIEFSGKAPGGFTEVGEGPQLHPWLQGQTEAGVSHLRCLLLTSLFSESLCYDALCK